VGELVESSMNFDLDTVEPFLRRVSPLIDAGFGEKEIKLVVELATKMEHEDEQEIRFQITFQGSASELRIRIFMDDTDAPDIYFFSTAELAEKIDSEMERFAEDLGI
jgi:hypothetical protein